MKPDKIALIYRSPKKNRYSIETLFSTFDALPVFDKVVLPVELDSISHLFRLIAFSFSIRNRKVHITGDVNYMAMLLFRKKIVITVHDLNHYEDLHGLRKYIYGLIWFSLPLTIAKKIVVISPYAKTQLLQHFNINERKIVIIPNSFIPSAGADMSGIENQAGIFRILCIGGKDNKNIMRLINAIKDLKGNELRFVGDQPKTVTAALTSYGIPFSIVANLSREALNAEYQACSMLYFASTKEGFGLPILEAQSAGKPVLTSTTTAMPFVAGTAAVLVDPYSEDEIRQGIIKIKGNGPEITEMITAGFQNLKRFSQEGFLSQYQNIYAGL